MDGWLPLMSDEPSTGTSTHGVAAWGSPAALADWLLDRQARCNVVDAHLFASILARRWHGGGLGLEGDALARLLGRYFPAALCDCRPFDAPATRRLPMLLAAEVADLRGLILAHRSQGAEEESWLATLIAHACLDDGPLWQDLGLTGPRQLSALFERHFHALARMNPTGTRWRAVLYRLICARDGLLVCTKTACRDCGAGSVCFGAID